MTATLDQQLQDLCDIHGLEAISLTAYNANHGKFVGVSVHSARVVGSSLGAGLDFTGSFKAALADLHAKQGLSVPDAFAPMEVAA